MKQIIIFLAVFLFGCSPTERDYKLFVSIESDKSGIDFVNQVSNSEDFNIFSYRNFYNGGGVAIGDINNDGLSDIFFTSNMGSNKLYVNKGDFEFKDISEKAGIQDANKWSTGVVFVDINQDSLLDIYVCNAGYRKNSNQKNTLYLNNGDLTFRESAASFGLDENGYTTHAAFFDYDRDGDLDVYILNNSFIPVNTLNYSNKRELRAEDWPVRDFLKGGGDKLLKNNAGVFEDVSEEAGIYGSLIGFGLGVTVGDLDGDHWPDIYVSNDFFERDYLYINKKDGTFSEELENRVGHLSHSSMGADMADINNDGHQELFVTDMLPDDEYRLKTTSTFDNVDQRNLKIRQGFYNQFMHNTLQLNNGTGQFSEISFYSGVAASDWSWGALMFDADNDRYTDIIVCNGIYHEVIDQDFIDFFANEVIQQMVLSGNRAKLDSVINKMPSVPIPNKAFRNDGNLKFEEFGEAWGLNEETFSNGAAYGDLDNDGDYDLVINNVNQQALIYQNNSDKNFIGFQLNFQKPNVFGIGAKVKVYSSEQVLSRELMPSRGFQSSIDYKILFGLGESQSLDSVVVYWPNGNTNAYKDLPANEYHVLNYNNEETNSPKPVRKTGALFTQLEIDLWHHEEDAYEDFYYERNIPVRLSKEGPCAAFGDLNGDGSQDIYIGGAAGQASQLLMSGTGGFISVQNNFFERFKSFEDTCAEFFDADNDGDLDLVVGSGGNNVTYINRAFRDRLYINNQGVFELVFNALPSNALNTSVIKPYDYDSDGDLDLFIGSRSIPGEYGMSPGSFIYQNNGKGQFRDITQLIVPELALAGMTTDALWADVLPEEGTELVLVGEWMSPKILSYDGAKFNIIDTELAEYAGWWQSIYVLDVEKDGDLDLVLGNIGENSYFKADSLNPLLLWINDFDGNSSIEKIITTRKDGRDFPVVMKRDLTDQLPDLKKENLLHSEYAKKSILELLSPEKLSTATIKQTNYLSSAIAINDGNGGFNVEKLDPLIQLSCINDIAGYDVNNDGYEDLIIAGNNHYFQPQFSMLDACKGDVLINDQQGGFTVMSQPKTGLYIKGVVRELKIIDQTTNPKLIALINNENALVYQLTNEEKSKD